MKIASSSATTPTFQSAGPLTSGIGGEGFGLNDALPTANQFAPGPAKSKPMTGSVLGQLVDDQPTGDGKVQPKSEPVDFGYGGLIDKRSRSPSPSGLDDPVITSSPVHKRPKGETEDLDERAEHGLSKALSPNPTTERSGGASVNVNGASTHAGQAGNAEPGVEYAPNNISPDQYALGHGASVASNATTAAPLANILNDENSADSRRGTSSFLVGGASTPVEHLDNTGQPGFLNQTSSHDYLPSQASHSQNIPAAAYGAANKLHQSSVDSSVSNGHAVTPPAAAQGPDVVPSVDPAFTASDNEIQQLLVHTYQGNGVGQYAHPTSAANVSDMMASAADSDSQQLVSVPSVLTATIHGPVNQGYQQPGDYPPITHVAFIPDDTNQQLPVPTGLGDPNIIAHAILDGDAPFIAPGQLQLVILSVAQHLNIELPAMGLFGHVGPGVPDNVMSVSLSTQAPLDGASEPFNAFETAFLRALIPPVVAASMSVVPDPPHEAVATRGNVHFSSAD